MNLAPLNAAGWLSIGQAAELLEVSRNTVNRMIVRGQLRQVIERGRVRFVRRDELDGTLAADGTGDGDGTQAGEEEGCARSAAPAGGPRRGRRLEDPGLRDDEPEDGARSAGHAAVRSRDAGRGDGRSGGAAARTRSGSRGRGHAACVRGVHRVLARAERREAQALDAEE
ncbi:MAG: helix-turn-helix domain-containing protein [Myxococcales bacterium]|nr:helix-turn-helix domain-containing protein [Myxococcales bacterium]